MRMISLRKQCTLLLSVTKYIPQTPSASVPSGRYSEAKNVSLTSPEPFSSIYYTLDGSTPTIADGLYYRGTIKIDSPVTLKAIAVVRGAVSEVLTCDYFIFGVQSDLDLSKPQLTKPMDGQSNDSELLKYFPGDLSIASSALPVKAVKKVAADGSYTVKVSIGMDLAMDNDKVWNKYKKKMKEAGQAKEKTECLKSFHDILGENGKILPRSSFGPL